MSDKWGSAFKISVYVEGAHVDSAHIIDASAMVSEQMKKLGYKVNFVGASSRDVYEEPKDQGCS
jgi:hypothetical protein